MPRVECPTCVHAFNVEDRQLNAIICCPNCELSLRACDNLVPQTHSARLSEGIGRSKHELPERVPTSSESIESWWQPLTVKQQQWSAPCGVVALIVLIVIMYNSGADTEINPAQPHPVAPTVTEPLQADSTALRPEPIPQRGQIDWTIAEKARRSWQDGNFRSADQAEQIAAMLVILDGVRNAIPDPVDREVTLDYIQRNIESW